jgi:hypothetical protein
MTNATDTFPEYSSGIPRNVFFVGGGSTIQLRTKGRENGDLGAPLNFQMSETRILIRFLRMYFPWTWEFG